MIEITRVIDGAEDFELGQPRLAPLQYDLTWPQHGEAAGLVLVIAGFGDDAASGYSQALRRHIVETTGMGAVSVRYHAFHARPKNGAKVRLDRREHLYLIGEAIACNAPVDDYTDADALVRALAAVNANVKPRISLKPAHDERQNFGVMQALDHVRVVGDLLEHAPPFDARRIVALGSSHGGYIAHLMAKFAPSTLAAIIDNSSYAQPPMAFLSIGNEPETLFRHEGLTVGASVESVWSVSDRQAPNFYDRDRDLIRDVRFLPHALAMRAAAADGGTQYFMVNAQRDGVSPAEVKRRQHEVLARAGFESHLQIVGADAIDGALFKSDGHGLGCSLKRLFDRHIGQVRRRGTDPDARLGSVVAYDCVDRGYRFRHTACAPYVEAEVYDLYEQAPDVVSAAA